MLLVVYCTMFISGNFFPHQHIIDGKKVVHSHPFSTHPHGHTSQSIVSIYYISHTVALPSEMSHLLEVDVQLEETTPLQQVVIPWVVPAFNPPLRAPPSIEA